MPLPAVKQKADNDKRAAEDAERLAEFISRGDITELSVRSVRKVLKCGQARAQNAIVAHQGPTRLKAVQ